MQTTISGYEVKVTHNGIPYTIYTKTGFRGINIPCLAWYDKGWYVSVQGKSIPIRIVMCDLKCVAQMGIPY